jgi:F0F1-type ATP synthase epsilon subunit
MAENMKLVLIADEEKIVEDSISKLTITSDEGESITILPKHIPMLSKIQERVSFDVSGGKMREFHFSVGFMYTNGDECFVVVDDLKS